MGKRVTRLDPRIEALLDAAGVSWEIVRGSKHSQLRVGGIMVMVVPHNHNAGCNTTQQNAISGVRRFLRSYVNVK